MLLAPEIFIFLYYRGYNNTMLIYNNALTEHVYNRTQNKNQLNRHRPSRNGTTGQA